MRDHRPDYLRNLLKFFGLATALLITSCAPAEDGGFQDVLGLRGTGGAAQNPVEFSVLLVPEGKAGEVALRISAKLPPDHYIYSTTPGQGAETKIKVTEAVGLEALSEAFDADHDPKVVDDPDLGGTVEKYFKQITWTRRYRITPGTATEGASVKGSVKYQVCNARTCRPGEYKFNAKLDSANSAPATQPPAVETERSTQFEQLVGRKGSQTVEGIWSVLLTPRQARPGSEVTITMTADLRPGWHVYALDQMQLPGGEGPSPTAMGLTEHGPLNALGPTFVGPDPIDAPSEWEGLRQRYHEGRIQWTGRFRVPEDTSQQEIPLAGKVAWTLCNDRGCQPATGFKFGGKLIVAADEIAEPVALSVIGTLDVARAGETIDELRPGGSVRIARGAGEGPATEGPMALPAPGGNARQARNVPGEVKGFGDPDGNRQRKLGAQGLPLFLAAAVLAGFAALLTPCVFPMIPITVSFFQKQTEKQHHRPVTMAFVYCLGIMGTFTGLGMLMSIVFGAGSLNQLSNSVLLNLFIGGILVFFAFNLLGLFEIRMPSWLLTYTAGKESKGGFIGVLFMALTFTLTSFTCTFAFAGLLLAEATRGDRFWPILGLLAFSAAFSLPFFFLALFPSFLQKLPKSGGWMNVVKVIMALVELGAAFKYFGTADQTWNGQAAILDFHLMVSAWAVISVAASLYLLGLFRLPHDMATDHIGVLRFVSAMSFMGLAAYLAVGLFSAEKPHGQVWKYIEAFANPDFDGGTDRIGPYLEHGRLKYALDFERALEFAIAENKPLFMDFTGVNCANCRYMEKGPMSQPQIEERLARFVRIQLFTDAVPKVPDRREAERLREFNARLQADWYGDVSLPSYVIIPPDRSVLKDRSKILSDLAGKNDEATFAQFLDLGWNKWQKAQAGRNGKIVGQR